MDFLGRAHKMESSSLNHVQTLRSQELHHNRAIFLGQSCRLLVRSVCLEKKIVALVLDINNRQPSDVACKPSLFPDSCEGCIRRALFLPTKVEYMVRQRTIAT
jgi:hypothetical protein